MKVELDSRALQLLKDIHAVLEHLSKLMEKLIK